MNTQIVRVFAQDVEHLVLSPSECGFFVDIDCAHCEPNEKERKIFKKALNFKLKLLQA